MLPCSLFLGVAGHFQRQIDVLDWKQTKVDIAVQGLGANPFTIEQALGLGIAANGIRRPVIITDLLHGKMNEIRGLDQLILRTTAGTVRFIDTNTMLFSGNGDRPLFSIIISEYSDVNCITLFFM
ncbi:MAG: hypothetical protein BAA01_01280 [Bacillus thermozeamaize]|uniref:Uncharacterized protein n=1 Tax=Bacillus thermozeamaize TaxID=230954 RepID=A0A1Y3PF97_9BACI|nr:MAG: hypothetical protein BAA01_01280 [Bacillus thermozeamaize]